MTETLLLNEDKARRFASIALGHVGRVYPHKLDHVLNGEAADLHPQVLHPCFFGSFDWHSCVHGWWTLLTLRRLFPAMPEAGDIARLADDTFTSSNLAVERAYFEQPSAGGFERPYGWAWLLYLHLEATRHQRTGWSERLEPLARDLATRLKDYLRKLTYPISEGTHANTAFALVLAREWAARHDPVLMAMIDDWGLAAFGEKRDYRGWEPSGDAFLSPVLTAALLMSRVMPHLQFAPWFDGLVGQNGWLTRECQPVTVSDRSDGKIAHLDGLNLSRAWCLREIGNACEGKAQTTFDRLAERHLRAALPYIAGHYAGEHWLASFALLALQVDQ